MRQTFLRWFGLALALGLLLACSFGRGVPQEEAAAIAQAVPQAQVLYYGGATCGATALPVEITLEASAPLPQQVGVQYRLVGATSGDWKQMPAAPSGGNRYLALVAPADQEVALLKGGSGHLEFRVYTLDAQGQAKVWPQGKTLQVPIQPCQKAASAAAQDQEAPRILRVLTPSGPVYAHGQCAPHTVTVTAIVVDDSGQATATLEYWFEGSGGGGSPQVQRLAMTAQGTAFQATVPVAQAVPSGATSGQLRFRVVATDPAGHQAVYPPNSNPALGVAVQAACGSGVSQAGNGSNSSNSGSSGGGLSGGSSSGGGKPGGPTAAAPPPARPPSGGASSGQPSTTLTIQEVRAYPDEAYFGTCSGGETTWVEIEVVAAPLDQVSTAQVRYRYDLSSLPQGNDFPHSASMYRAQGVGNYTARIEVGQEVPDHAAIDQLVYYVEVITKDGRKVTSRPKTFPLRPCSAAAGGAAGGSNAGGAFQIQDVVLTPDTVYAGFCDAAHPTVLQVQATVSPASEVQQVQVHFGYVPQPNQLPLESYSVTLSDQGGGVFGADVDLNQWYAQNPPQAGLLVVSVTAQNTAGQEESAGPYYLSFQPCSLTFYVVPTIDRFAADQNTVDSGASYTLSWQTSDATCGVYLDGSQVDATGQMTLTAPSVNQETSVSHILEAYGEPCDNPSRVEATVDVVVQPVVNRRISNDEQLYWLDSYDLDWDGTSDFTFKGDEPFFTLEAENGALFRFASGSPTLEECRLLFQSGGGDTLLYIDDRVIGQSICVLTGSSRVGYVTLLELNTDLFDRYLRFSLESEMP